MTGSTRGFQVCSEVGVQRWVQEKMLRGIKARVYPLEASDEAGVYISTIGILLHRRGEQDGSPASLFCSSATPFFAFHVFT